MWLRQEGRGRSVEGGRGGDAVLRRWVFSNRLG